MAFINWAIPMRIFFSLAILLISSSLHALTLEQHNVEAFVNKALDYAKNHGKEKALEEFSKPQGEFIQGDLYIFAYDFTGTVLAHGGNPEFVGKNFMDLKYTNGLLVYKLNELVRHKKGGWVDYYWYSPREKKVVPKMGYVLKVDDTYWIGAGIYKKEGDHHNGPHDMNH